MDLTDPIRVYLMQLISIRKMKNSFMYARRISRIMISVAGLRQITVNTHWDLCTELKAVMLGKYWQQIIMILFASLHLVE